MACSEIRTSARLCDLRISIRSTNRPSCEASMVGRRNFKNVISISPRRGPSILATKLSKYLLAPRYLRKVRAGRTTRCPDGEENSWLRLEWKWSESDRSWVIPDKAFANASGEKYPKAG